MGTALHEAARDGNEGIVNDLLEGGASVAAKDVDGRTPLHFAAQGGRSQIVQILMLKGVDTKTPLTQVRTHAALSSSLFPPPGCGTRSLLVAGADTSLRCGPRKESVVQAVAQHDRVMFLRAAIERGAHEIGRKRDHSHLR